MKRRLTFIAVWGLGCLVASMIVVGQLLFFTNGPDYWVIAVLGVGVPTAGLLLALLGLLPGTRPAVQVFVRVLPPADPDLRAV